MKDENLRLRKQMEAEATSFQSEREAWDAEREELEKTLRDLKEKQAESHQAKEDLGREKERQNQEKETLEKRLLEAQLEQKHLEEELKKSTEAVKQGELDANELREQEQGLRILQQSLDREKEKNKRGEERIRHLEGHVRVLDERLEEAHVKQRRLKDSLASLDKEKRREEESFKELRQHWEERVTSVSRELEEERRSRKVRNLKPLQKVLRLEGILPRSTLLRSLEPDTRGATPEALLSS